MQKRLYCGVIEALLQANLGSMARCNIFLFSHFSSSFRPFIQKSNALSSCLKTKIFLKIKKTDTFLILFRWYERA